MTRVRKARKNKTPRGLKHAPKPESLFDRRGFVTTVAGTVVGEVILDGLHAIRTPPNVDITPPVARAALTPGPPVAMKLTLTFGTPVPQDEVPQYRA